MASELEQIAEVVRHLASDSKGSVRSWVDQSADHARRSSTAVPSGAPSATAVSACFAQASVSLQRASGLLSSFAEQAEQFAASLAGGGGGDSGAIGGRRRPVAPGPLSTAEVKRTLAESNATPAGRSFHAEPHMSSLAANVVPVEGMYVVDSHGMPSAVQLGELAVDAKGLAQVLKSDPNWDQKSPVLLLSCSTGAGQGSLAQQLASLLNVDVVAPNGLVWSDAQGRPFVSDEDSPGMPVDPPNGAFVVFSPDKDGVM